MPLAMFAAWIVQQVTEAVRPRIGGRLTALTVHDHIATSGNLAGKHLVSASVSTADYVRLLEAPETVSS